MTLRLLDTLTGRADEFAPLTPESLMNLPAYHAAVRLAIEGQTSRPFMIRTLPLPTPTDATLARDAMGRCHVNRVAGWSQKGRA